MLLFRVGSLRINTKHQKETKYEINSTLEDKTIKKQHHI